MKVKSVDTNEPQRDEHLRSADFLDVEHHPKITFRSTSVRPVGPTDYVVTGDLTIRGVTRERPIVVYEEDSGMRAARIVWFLQFFGHPDARILDGGVRRWRGEGGPLMRDAVEPEATTLGVETLGKAGITAVIQPGGSKKDPEVTAAAERLGMAMVHTGERHFRH